MVQSSSKSIGTILLPSSAARFEQCNMGAISWRCIWTEVESSLQPICYYLELSSWNVHPPLRWHDWLRWYFSALEGCRRQGGTYLLTYSFPFLFLRVSRLTYLSEMKMFRPLLGFKTFVPVKVDCKIASMMLNIRTSLRWRIFKAWSLHSGFITNVISMPTVVG